MRMPLAITGTGAVSSAGWGVPALMKLISSGEMAPLSVIQRPYGDETVGTPVFRVPAEGSTTPKFSRLRRTSPISKYAAAAVAEALGEERLARIQSGELRVGVIFTLMNGCVNYSNRFFGEVMTDPSVASPILFPETVFNAPSSHLSALLGSHAPNDTLISDSAGFFSGMDLAAEWLIRGEMDGCLVVSSEEIDWLSAEALQLYAKDACASEGAAAIYLEPADGPVKLLRIPDPIPLSNHTRQAAAIALRDLMQTTDNGGTLLVDALTGHPALDAPEASAWSYWTGPRCSPKKQLGEGLGVSAGLQVIVAAEALKAGHVHQAVVVSTGANQQAGGVLLGRA